MTQPINELNDEELLWQQEGFQPKRLNHAVLYVSDVTKSVYFYSNVMSMEVIATAPKMTAAFLRIKGSRNHHDLGLIRSPYPIPKTSGSIGLYHLAWQVATVKELLLAKSVLIKEKSYYGEANHGATLSIYGRDPDGIDFEVMWMLPRHAWGEYEHQAIVEYLNLDEAYKRWTDTDTFEEM